MDLNFQKVGSFYVADFTAESDFNVHIEKENGDIFLMQSTIANGEYDYVHNANFNRADSVIDVDFTALVYPKHIRVKSRVLPTKATVTFA